ncbi:transcriptional regulator [Paraburkholderia caribensis]|nr:transcriptional regulator [Paraburkholderia caribensis]
MVASRDVSLHGDYLASSSDLADLERRMRQVDEEDHAYRMPFCGAVSRDQNSFGSKH